MPVYLCQFPDNKSCGIIAGENEADAVLAYDKIRLGSDKQDDLIMEEADGSLNTYCEQLLAQYEVRELHRHDVLEWVERCLDGDNSITIHL